MCRHGLDGTCSVYVLYVIIRELVNQIMPGGNFKSNFSQLIGMLGELKKWFSLAFQRAVILFEP